MQLGYYTDEDVPLPLRTRRLLCPKGTRMCRTGLSPHKSETGLREGFDRLTRARCPAVLMEPGYYCPGDGFRHKCRAGSFGDHEGSSSEQCTGDCSAGYYCPPGSTNGTAVRCGGGQSAPLPEWHATCQRLAALSLLPARMM